MKLHYFLPLCLWGSILNAADVVLAESTGPISNVHFVAPLKVEEALNWHMYSQVVLVKEKDHILFDTMETKNQMIIVQSISYFKAANGQLYAIINYLRPRQTPK
jgi:hypothetical protein